MALRGLPTAKRSLLDAAVASEKDWKALRGGAPGGGGGGSLALRPPAARRFPRTLALALAPWRRARHSAAPSAAAANTPPAVP
jgi:hypothetical protein